MPRPPRGAEVNPHRTAPPIEPDPASHEGLFNGAYHLGRLVDCPVCLHIANALPQVPPDAAEHAASELRRRDRGRYWGAVKRGAGRILDAIGWLLGDLW